MSIIIRHDSETKLNIFDTRSEQDLRIQALVQLSFILALYYYGIILFLKHLDPNFANLRLVRGVEFVVCFFCVFTFTWETQFFLLAGHYWQERNYFDANFVNFASIFVKLFIQIYKFIKDGIKFSDVVLSEERRQSSQGELRRRRYGFRASSNLDQNLVSERFWSPNLDVFDVFSCFFVQKVHYVG